MSKEKDTRSVFRRREPKNQTSSAEFDFEAKFIYVASNYNQERHTIRHECGCECEQVKKTHKVSFLRSEPKNQTSSDEFDFEAKFIYSASNANHKRHTQSSMSVGVGVSK